MFTNGIPQLLGPRIDPRSVSVTRPYDAVSGICASRAAEAVQADLPTMIYSARVADPEGWARIQKERRNHLEAFIWADPGQINMRRVGDLVVLICEESTWSAPPVLVDPSSHPNIDLQAAETGMLLAWILRRHGVRLLDTDPTIPDLIVRELRRRLFIPVSMASGYSFLEENGCRLACLILSDLLLTCLLTESDNATRVACVRRLLRPLDNACRRNHGAGEPLRERLTEACAIADTARILKRLTRGELDLTRELPDESWRDDILTAWAAQDYFIDPCGGPDPVSAVDVFRLGYLTSDRMLRSIGASLVRSDRPDSASITGRVLSMEYMPFALDETGGIPRLRRAANADASLVTSRTGAFTVAMSGAGSRANAGDVTLFLDKRPILIDAGGLIHNLPVIAGRQPEENGSRVFPQDADFADERDMISCDLTGAYPASCCLSSYQRTLLVLRQDESIRLVDAFDFARGVDRLTFRFVTRARPVLLSGYARISGCSVTWGKSLAGAISSLDEMDGYYLFSLSLVQPPRRLICDFCFEQFDG